MKLSEKLQTLRKKNNLTQQELANKLYISRSLYAKYENLQMNYLEQLKQKINAELDDKIKKFKEKSNLKLKGIKV